MSIHTGKMPAFQTSLLQEIATANEVLIASAFITFNGLIQILEELSQALLRGCSVTIITGDYLNYTQPAALKMLCKLSEHAEERGVPSLFNTYFLRVHGTKTSFHPKVYIFRRGNSDGTCWVGSSNLTGKALLDGIEWNVQIRECEQKDVFEKILAEFDSLKRLPGCFLLTREIVQEYELKWHMPIQSPESDQPKRIEPNSIQREALELLNQSRLRGKISGLCVLATGLGKTWLAAFDVQQMGAKGVLFLAHREEILSQARSTFELLFPDSRFGTFTGSEKIDSADFLFASVQTLTKQEHLNRFERDRFEYIIVDEFHHAVASTYRRIIHYFSPKFLLGLTATKSRTDGESILSLCENNLVIERNIIAGINSNLLCPFEYRGIEDKFVDYSKISFRDNRFAIEDFEIQALQNHRAEQIFSEWMVHRKTRTLGFCSSIKHCDFMAEYFNRKSQPESRVRAVSVHSKSQSSRAAALCQLRDHEIDVIFSVDLFNEGIDLPSIDTILMLRPTESKIVFLQQFGRGLRRTHGKSSLVVIDFIGNHRSFLHKPIALLLDQGLVKSGSAFSAVESLKAKSIILPPFCKIDFDPKVIGFLEKLASREAGEVGQMFHELSACFGRRPTLTEFCSAYIERTGKNNFLESFDRFGGWFSFIKSQNCLATNEEIVLRRFEDFLMALLKEAMQKSYKMIFLEAFVELQGFYTHGSDSNPVPVSKLASLSFRLLAERSELRDDIPSDMMKDFEDAIRTGNFQFGETTRWRAYWSKNPVFAWTGGWKTKEPYFIIERDNLFSRVIPEADCRDAFESFVSEIVEFRLFVYRRKILNSMLNRCSAKINERYAREDIPSVFGEVFNPGNWNTGHISLHEKKIEVLLATIESNVNDDGYRYENRLDEAEGLFFWQSQNQTSIASAKAKRIINHVREEIEVHLFLRRLKRDKFSYCGTLGYVSHSGENPINFIFSYDKEKVNASAFKSPLLS